MADTVEETQVELDEATLGQLSEKVGTALIPGLMDKLQKAMEENSKKSQDEILSRLDDVKRKSVVDRDELEGDNEDIKKGLDSGEFKGLDKMSKELRFFRSADALQRGNFSELSRINRYTMALRTKAGYNNETTAADGSVLVPDPEFDTTIYENLPNYGVAFRFANVRNTDRTAVYAISLDTGLTFYSTAEAGVKTGAKLAFSRQQTNLQKYAVIVPATEELTDDAAVDYWRLVTNELARAYARKADEITFTDNTYGISEAGSSSQTLGAGPILKTVSGAGTTVTWDDLRSAEAATEDSLSQEGNQWFMRKETFARLAQTKASSGSGDYLYNGWVGNINQPATPWGTPIVFTRVLTKSADLGNNGALAVYGDLRNYNLWNRQGMEMTLLTEATIKGSDGADFNLATQDGKAMRAVVRMLGKLPKGNAQKFVVLGAGTIS